MLIGSLVFQLKLSLNSNSQTCTNKLHRFHFPFPKNHMHPRPSTPSKRAPQMHSSDARCRCPRRPHNVPLRHVLSMRLGHAPLMHLGRVLLTRLRRVPLMPSTPSTPSTLLKRALLTCINAFVTRSSNAHYRHASDCAIDAPLTHAINTSRTRAIDTLTRTQVRYFVYRM